MLGQQRRQQWMRRNGLLVPTSLPPIVGNLNITEANDTITAAGGSGTYDNLTNWPSALNRPQLSGNVLSWIGPIGGGPSTNADVAQTRTLTSSGGLSTTQNGQTIAGLKFNTGAGIEILHNNVTIKQCAFDGSTGEYITQISTANRTGITFEDNYFQGNKANRCAFLTGSGSSMVATSPSAIRRNYLTGFDNHLTLWCSGNWNMVVEDNFFTAPGNTAQGSDWDGDMIEVYAADHLTIRHNVFDGTGAQATGTFNSMINIGYNAVSNCSVDGNLFANCQRVNEMICVGDFFTVGDVAWSCTNNGFYLSSGKDYYRHGVTPPTVAPNPNSGNFTAASMTATSGTLVNGGTGAV